MTPVERLQAAIEKLEQHAGETWLRDGAPAARGWESFTATVSASNPGGDRQVTGPLHHSDADLIVTLHRTIDAQLETLHAAWNTIAGTEEMPDGKDPKVWYGRYAAAALALADAILGSDQ